MASTPKKVIPAPVVEPAPVFEAAPPAPPAAFETAPVEAQKAVETAAAEVNKATEAAAAPVVEIQHALRKAVEKNVVDSRAAFARAKVAADEAAGALESSVSTASKGVVEFNTKALDTLRANAEANFDFLKALVNAKTVGEILSLQSEFARKQAETVGAQAKEFSALAQKIAAEASEPIKAQVAKTFKIAV